MKSTPVDGTGYLLFLRQVSQLYQGLGTIDPPPYYEPEAIKFPEPSKAPSPLFDRVDPSAPPPWEQPEKKAMEFVAFRLTAAQLDEVHGSVKKGIEDPKITRMDTVVGLLARCLSEVEPESKPIDTISYLINVRLLAASPVHSLTPLASRNGCIPAQRSGQRVHFPLRRSKTLERGRSSRRRFGLCHGNTKVAGKVEGPQVDQRLGGGCRQGTVTDRVGQGWISLRPEEGLLGHEYHTEVGFVLLRHL